MADATEATASLSAVTDQELRRCTVKIDVDGAPKGSGFFVAPGHVVTCAHVLEALDPAAPDPARVMVRDIQDDAYRVAKVADLWPDDDLAVLRVEPAYDHPCVLLIPGLRMNDRLVTFGYPERRREGVPRTLTSEGTTGDDRLHTLAEGQVQPGMSGAPVLNLRTGGVCGVLRLTRNQDQALGGYAIPIELLKLRSPKLVTMSDRYHADNRSWFDLLPPHQKSALLDSHGGVVRSGGPKRTFVVSVRREDQDWTARATLHPGGSIGPERIDLNAVREKVARLFRNWAVRNQGGRPRVVRGRVDPGEELRLLGAILFSAVLPGDIGSRFAEELPAVDEWVELALHFKPDLRALIELPWECMYLESGESGVMTDIRVATDHKLAFVRVLDPQPRQSEQPQQRQLSVLMVGIQPQSEAGASAVERIVEKAAKVARASGVSAEVRMELSPEGLAHECATGAYDILHYVGFGQYEDGADRLALAGRGRHQFEDAQVFAARLSARRPRVVVLEQVDWDPEHYSSRDPSPPAPADLSVFAWSLLHQGVEAVVAYQFPVSAELSDVFNKTLYEELASGKSIERATQNARTQMWMKKQAEHAFLSPAVFVGQPGELRLISATPDSTPLARVGVHAAHA